MLCPADLSLAVERQGCYSIVLSIRERQLVGDIGQGCNPSDRASVLDRTSSLWLDRRQQSLPSAHSAPKVALMMYFHSVQMMLYRPCLCEILLEHESNTSRQFRINCARACILAAVSFVSMLPDYLVSHNAYHVLPWWSLLHYTSQTMAIVTLELCLRAQHVLQGLPKLMACLQEATAYIRYLGETSTSACRAGEIFRGLLITLLRRYEQFDVADTLNEASYPINM
jgi:hypothetical protein